jgi:hypothetical protein
MHAGGMSQYRPSSLCGPWRALAGQSALFGERDPEQVSIPERKYLVEWVLAKYAGAARTTRRCRMLDLSRAILPRIKARPGGRGLSCLSTFKDRYRSGRQD